MLVPYSCRCAHSLDIFSRCGHKQVTAEPTGAGVNVQESKKSPFLMFQDEEGLRLDSAFTQKLSDHVC